MFQPDKGNNKVNKGFYGDDFVSCPKCNRLFNAKEIVRILEEYGVSEKTINAVKKETQQ